VPFLKLNVIKNNSVAYVPICSDNSPAKLQIWYRNFANHALSCGYYVVPYKLLLDHHGGSTALNLALTFLKPKSPNSSIGKAISETFFNALVSFLPNLKHPNV
jgi:hypothetical protein